MQLRYTGQYGNEIKLYLNPNIISDSRVYGDFIIIHFHSTIKDSKQVDYKWSWTSTISSVLNYQELTMFLLHTKTTDAYKATQERVQAELKGEKAPSKSKLKKQEAKISKLNQSAIKFD